MNGDNLLPDLSRIMVPLIKPALATVAIFTFQCRWNDFMAPLIYLHDRALHRNAGAELFPLNLSDQLGLSHGGLAGHHAAGSRRLCGGATTLH